MITGVAVVLAGEGARQVAIVSTSAANLVFELADEPQFAGRPMKTIFSASSGHLLVIKFFSDPCRLKLAI
jgi:hypothetical protein